MSRLRIVGRRTFERCFRRCRYFGFAGGLSQHFGTASSVSATSVWSYLAFAGEYDQISVMDEPVQCRVRGHAKAHVPILFGVIALYADQILRPLINCGKVTDHYT